ncbi:hypothetical protein PYH37_003127 [Sinorhizobium numidicum]|uniref:Uncharacterized protein n=1 Tax=Sinorhizobium numidicum TaxID=680248 RepID=A0ABY8D2M7_9HYPH|nr:hypothetical protein [Sinorhizobium numidicum]WEX79120.1 hypothetical protein PYH37_003127 [Sinorhizobium numidicum]WEX85146.1 hypothetical protein PYH38_003840 [Sinorhizobium numidicum]
MCAIVAAIYGAWSVQPAALSAQGNPATLAFLFVPSAS